MATGQLGYYLRHYWKNDRVFLRILVRLLSSKSVTILPYTYVVIGFDGVGARFVSSRPLRLYQYVILVMSGFGSCLGSVLLPCGPTQ